MFKKFMAVAVADKWLVCTRISSMHLHYRIFACTAYNAQFAVQ